MNELQRQQYLEAIGIETYMPRVSLPHAPDSQQCDVSFDPNALAKVESQSQSIGLPANNASPASVVPPVINKLVDNERAQSPKNMVDEVLTAAIVQAPQSKPKAKPAAQGVSFALSLWRISDDLLVVDSRQSQLALPTEPLLSNILLALGRNPQLPQVDVINWPVLDNPFEPKDAAAARQYVSTVLAGMASIKPLTHILLLGPQACHFVLSDDRLDVQVSMQVNFDRLLGQAINIEQLSCSAIIAPSLSQMLQEPSCKSQTWQAIQPLRIR